MQHGYQQFLLDGCSPPFSISQDVNNDCQEKNLQQQQQRFHQHLLFTSQHFFHHHHQFQAFQQQQQQIQHNSPAQIVPHLGNFRLAVTEGSIRQSQTPEATLGDDSCVKGPEWKFADLDCSNKGTKKCKNKFDSVGNKFFKKGGEEIEEHPEQENAGKNNNNSASYRLFGELEAIYSGSSSVLTGDNVPSLSIKKKKNNVPSSATIKSNMPETGDPNIDLGSEKSAEGEASLKNIQKKNKKRKRKKSESITVFFKNMVKQLIDHQEGLHRKFLEIMERKDQERFDTEEAWRRLDTARLNRETTIRREEQALASSREASIVSLLEKLTGETMSLAPRQGFVGHGYTHKDDEEKEKYLRQ